MLQNVKFDISYNGAGFDGWQRQPEIVDGNHKRTVENELLKVFNKIGQDVILIGCSRTDKGVHAKQYIFNTYIGKSLKKNAASGKIPVERLPLVLNNLLPGDIKIKSAEVVSEDFHARRNCLGKKYIYRAYCAKQEICFLKDFALFLRQPLNIEEINEKAKHLIGEHNFHSFMKTDPRNIPKSTVKNLFDVNIQKRNIFTDLFCESYELYELTISGSGFLYNMIRIITGTLFNSKYKSENIIKALECPERNRNLLGVTLPPHGLYLEEVFLKSD